MVVLYFPFTMSKGEFGLLWVSQPGSSHIEDIVFGQDLKVGHKINYKQTFGTQPGYKFKFGR